MKFSKREWEELLDSVKVLRSGIGITTFGSVLVSNVAAAFTAVVIWGALTLLIVRVARQIDITEREVGRR